MHNVKKIVALAIVAALTVPLGVGAQPVDATVLR